MGYVVRPLGGIIFSHLGDEIGRKMVLMLSMILMGVASLGLGLLPTYDQIGIWAPILMILMRLLQGLAIGGELPSTIVYAAESIPERRGFAIGIIFAVTVGGLLPGMLINIGMTHLLTAEQIHQFGWRIPFFAGGLLCLVAYQIRKKLHETTAFNHLKQHNKFPLLELLKNHFGSLMIGVGLVSIMATPILLTLLFMPTYLTKILHFDAGKVSNTILFTTALSALSVYLMGLLTSRFSPSSLMKKGIIGLVCGAAACYYMLFKDYNLTLALSLFTVFQGALVVLPPLLLCDLFPIQIRLTGVALSYNLAFVFFGGLTPIVVTTLIEHTQMPYMAPFLCLLGVSCIAFVALWFYVTRNRRSSFSETAIHGVDASL
jgi:MFS family permease